MRPPKSNRIWPHLQVFHSRKIQTGCLQRGPTPPFKPFMLTLKNEVECRFSFCCKILDSDRETIARLRNCIMTLTDNGVMLFNTSLQYAYDASMKHAVGNVFKIHF